MTASELSSAELVDLGHDITGLRAELVTLEAAAVPLLAQLSVLEGIEFDGSILLSQRTGPWTPDLAHNQPAGQMLHCELQAPDQVRPDISGRYLAPKSRRLRAEIYVAELRAEKLRQSLDPPADQPRIAAAEMLALHNFHPQPPAPKIPTAVVTEKGISYDATWLAQEAAAKERDRLARGLKMDGQDKLEATRRAAEDKRA